MKLKLGEQAIETLKQRSILLIHAMILLQFIEKSKIGKETISDHSQPFMG